MDERLNRRKADLFLTEDVPVEFVAFNVLLRVDQAMVNPKDSYSLFGVDSRTAKAYVHG